MRAVETIKRGLKMSNPTLRRLGLYLAPVMAIVKFVFKAVRRRLRITNFTICLMGVVLGLGAGLFLLRGFLFEPGLAAYWDLHWWYSSSIYPMYYLWDEYFQAPVVINHMLGYLLIYLFPAEIGERLLFLLIFTIMGFSMFFATFKLTAPRHRTARVPLIAATLTTLFFVFNPIICTRVWHWQVLWFYAFLPLLLYFSYAAFRDILSLNRTQFIKRAVILALVLFCMSVSPRMPLYFPFLLLALLAGLSRPYWDYLKRSGLFLVLLLGLYAVFCALWVIPTAMSSGYSPYWYVHTRGYVTAASQYSPMFNVFSLQAYQTDAFFKQIFSHAGLLATAWKACTLAIPIIAFGSILFKRSKLILWLAVFALVFIFLGKGANAPFGGFYEWLVFDAPASSFLGYQLRKPFMWHIPLMFCYAMLAGFTISYLLGFIKDRRAWSKLRKVIFVVLIPVFLAVPLVAGYPLLTGDVHGSMKPRELPGNWVNFTEWMENEGSDSKLIDYPVPPWWALPGPRMPRYYKGTRPSYSPHYTLLMRESIMDTLRLGELQSVYNAKYFLYWSDQVPGDKREEVFAALDRQKDLELEQQFGGIYLYGRTTDPSEIEASDQSIVAMGGIDNMLSLTTVESFNFADFPVVFLDQAVASSDRIPDAEILLSNQDNLDLYLSLLEQNYIIEPFGFVDDDPDTLWFKATLPYWQYTSLNVGLKIWQNDYGENFVWTQGATPLNMPFGVSETGKYDVFARCLHSEYGAEGIKALLDGELIKEVVTKDKIDEFRWDDLGTFDLEAGGHTLTLESIRGYNAVNLFAVIPHGQLEIYEKQVDEAISGDRIVYIWEAESALNLSNAEVSDRYNGNASNGEVINLSQGSKAWRDIEVLRGDEYRMAVRLNGSVTVGIDDESFSVSRDELGFTYLDQIYLEKGAHRIEVNAIGEGNSDLDVIWLYSIKAENETVEDIFISEYNSARVVEYEKLSPTRYRATVTADQPFMLTFAETYHPLWVANVNGREYQGVPVNSIGSGFWIEDTGELEIIIEFKPQSWFYYGVIISFISIAGALAFLLWNWRRKRWQWLRRPSIGNMQNAARTNIERIRQKLRSENSVSE